MLILSLLLISNPLPAELEAAMQAPEADPKILYEAEWKEETFTLRGTVDPSAPEGQRITVHEPAMEDWPDGVGKSLEKFDKAVSDGSIWCNDLGEMVGEDISVSNHSDDALTISFRPKPDDPKNKGDRAFAEVALGELDLAKSDAGDWSITGMRMRLEKPFKPMMVAKVTDLQVSIVCEPGPGGRTYQAETTTAVKGSAMGQRFDQFEQIRISNVRMVGVGE